MKSLEELRALREKMKSQTDNRSVAGSDETVIKGSSTRRIKGIFTT